MLCQNDYIVQDKTDIEIKQCSSRIRCILCLSYTNYYTQYKCRVSEILGNIVSEDKLQW